MKVLFLFWVTLAAAQFSTQISNTTIDLLPTNSAQPYIDPDYPNSTVNFMTVEMGTNNLYVLSSSNIVQVYSKAHPNILYQNFSVYSFANNHPYILINAVVNA